LMWKSPLRVYSNETIMCQAGLAVPRLDVSA